MSGGKKMSPDLKKLASQNVFNAIDENKNKSKIPSEKSAHLSNFGEFSL